jgi:hypothetical protein
MPPELLETDIRRLVQSRMREGMLPPTTVAIPTGWQSYGRWWRAGAIAVSKVRDFGFKPEHSQLLSARAHTAPAAVKVSMTLEPDLMRLPYSASAGRGTARVRRSR